MYVHLYDGATLLSEGDGTSPLSIGPLNATDNEVSAAKAVTIKTEAGYKTYGDTVISFTGTSAAKWTICATAGGTYGATITISTEVTSTGTTFYVKAASSSDETPVNDVATDVSVQTKIQAV